MIVFSTVKPETPGSTLVSTRTPVGDPQVRDGLGGGRRERPGLGGEQDGPAVGGGDRGRSHRRAVDIAGHDEHACRSATRKLLHLACDERRRLVDVGACEDDDLRRRQGGEGGLDLR